MISQQAKKSIESIFIKAARVSLLHDSSDQMAISLISDAEVEDIPEKTMIVLTISSFVFRLLTIFHINQDASTEQYFGRGAGDMSLIDAISEKGNLCCGTMNRELLKSFGHLGMSTPYVLGRECMEFLKELRPGHIARFEIVINDTVRLHVTLCMCENANIDFVVDESHEEETGALELF